MALFSLYIGAAMISFLAVVTAVATVCIIIGPVTINIKRAKYTEKIPVGMLGRLALVAWCSFWTYTWITLALHLFATI